MVDIGNVVSLFKKRLNAEVVAEGGGYRVVFTTVGHNYAKIVVVKTAVGAERVVRKDIANLGQALNAVLSKGIRSIDMLDVSDLAVTECIICRVGSAVRTFMRKAEDENSVILEEVV
jgi:hypothetical protein